MKKKLITQIFAITTVTMAAAFGTPAQAEDIKEMACGAVLCLFSGAAAPQECTPYLNRYFSIRKASDKINFLNLCPTDEKPAVPPDVVENTDATEEGGEEGGAESCNPESLNSSMAMSGGSEDGGGYISDQLPDSCAGIENPPCYVGTPGQGGYWATAQDCDSERAKYKEEHCNAQALNSALATSKQSSTPASTEATSSGAGGGAPASQPLPGLPTIVRGEACLAGSGTSISKQMPDYCSNMEAPPKYIGTPDLGGHWVEAQDYETALANYTDKLCEPQSLNCILAASSGSTDASASIGKQLSTSTAAGECPVQDSPSISKQLPPDCEKAKASLSYIGTPEQGGYWVAKKDADKASAEYKAQHCSAQSLNCTLATSNGSDDGGTSISKQLPKDCANMDAAPKYVGTPEQGGYWVEAKDYDTALAKYNSTPKPATTTDTQVATDSNGTKTPTTTTGTEDYDKELAQLAQSEDALKQDMQARQQAIQDIHARLDQDNQAVQAHAQAIRDIQARLPDIQDSEAREQAIRDIEAHMQAITAIRQDSKQAIQDIEAQQQAIVKDSQAIQDVEQKYAQVLTKKAQQDSTATTGTTTKNPDGSTSTVVTTTNPDGTTSTTTKTIKPDGTMGTTMKTTYPDGSTSTITVAPNPDGTTSTITRTITISGPATEFASIKDPDGSTTTKNPDGSTSTTMTTKNSDGTTNTITKTTSPDGTAVTITKTTTMVTETTTGTQIATTTTGTQGSTTTTGTQGSTTTTGTQGSTTTTGTQDSTTTTGTQDSTTTTGTQNPAATTGTQDSSASTGSQDSSASTGTQNPLTTAGAQSPASTTGTQKPASSTGGGVAPSYAGMPSLGSGGSSISTPSAGGGSGKKNASSQGKEAQADSVTSNGAVRCDALSLNHALTMPSGSNDGRTYIHNRLPDYCADTDAPPRYVGTPKRGGYWVKAQDYESELAEYSARVQGVQGE